MRILWETWENPAHPGQLPSKQSMWPLVNANASFTQKGTGFKELPLVFYQGQAPNYYIKNKTKTKQTHVQKFEQRGLKYENAYTYIQYNYI